ncbi:MAG: penicillin-binding protein [Parcubacteria group bacterium]
MSQIIHHSLNHEQAHPKKTRRFGVWFRRIFIAGIILFLVGTIFLVGAFAWYSRYLPDPNKILERNVAQSTKIYDRNGTTVLYDLHGNVKRTLVKLSDIPDVMKQATIAAEDRYFYEHRGFNPFSMIRGVLVDPLLGKSMRGGSTLTQQLVKNAILTNERSIARKIKELILSYKIETEFGKDDILQMYLNEIPYGSVVYGVEAASQTFFNKDVKDLDLAEAATLAAIPQAPTYYSPFGNHLTALANRQKYVLNQMVSNGYITKEQADAAVQEKLNFAVKRESIIAPHFVMYIRDLLTQKFGEDLVSNGGLKVTTTLDLQKQGFAENAVTNGVDARGKQYNFYNASLVSIDPKTGQILAMVGSKDYFDIEHDGNVNVALSPLQPGSSIKPFIYAQAFKSGYTPNTIQYDVKTVFETDTADYSPNNYDGQEHGPLTLRTALGHSLNIPAVKTLYLAGIDNVLDLLELNGYTTFGDRSRFGLSLVLGGGEVKLLEHTAGYGTLADEGMYHAPQAILSVEDSNGNILYQYKDDSHAVLEKQIVDEVTSIISDPSVRLSVNMSIPGRPNAAKTGTTNDFRAAWTMGYTPSLVTGVWVGNNDNSAMRRGADGTVVAAPIWKEYMTKALAGTPVENFPEVTIPTTGKGILDGDPIPESIVKIDKYTGLRATDATPSEAIITKTVREAHDILYYVDRDNPLGPIPLNPSRDPQFINWEAGVQDWLRRNGQPTTSDGLPTDFDNVHTEANRPTVIINTPMNNQAISGYSLTASVNVSAPRGVKRVEYYLDQTKIATATVAPFALNFPLNTYLINGAHQLRVKAFDDVDNSNEVAVAISINANLPAPTFVWQMPATDTTATTYNFPIPLRVHLTDLLSTSRVEFYQNKVDTSQANLFSTIINPTQADIQPSWPAVYEKGVYELYGVITDPNGDTHESSRIRVTVN